MNKLLQWLSGKPQTRTAEHHRKKGAKLLEQRRVNEALIELRRAYETEPGNFAGRMNLGTACYLKGNFEEAISHFRYVLAFEINNPSALLNLAASYDARDETDLAISTLETLVASSPGWKDANYNLAVAYYKKGDLAASFRSLEKELARDPQHQGARAMVRKLLDERVAAARQSSISTLSATDKTDCSLRVAESQ